MSKNGKPTLQDKAANLEASIDMANTDYFFVEPSLKREIEKQGMVCRWINAKKLQENYGFDRRQWKPYKKSSDSVATSNPFGGTDSEGFVRRGDLILAVRPKSIHDKYSEQINNKNKNLQKGHSKQAAEEIKQKLQESGTRGIEVLEGYDEN